MVRKSSPPTEPIITPFTIVYDDREGLPFRFECSRVGLNPDEPAASVDGQELRCPIEPSDGTIVPGLRMGFEINPSPGTDHSKN